MDWLERLEKTDTSLEVLAAATAPVFIVIDTNALLDDLLGV